MRRLSLIVALNALAVAFYLLIAVRMGFFTHISATLYSSPDSHAYHDVAEWLYGAAPNPFESQRRPFLFPLLLGGADRLGGATGVWVLNFLCWLGTLNLTAAGVWRMTGRTILAVLVFLVLASNISLIVLSFQALTELSTALLESAWILGLAFASFTARRPRDLALLFLPVALLTLVRPGNQLVLLVAVVLLPLAIYKMPRRRAQAVLAVAACCIPLLFQAGLMETANHFFGLSSAGAYQFRDYYASQVYASVNGLPGDLVAARAAVDPMSNGQLATFLLRHLGSAAATFFSNLHDNLTAGSAFIDVAQNPTLATAVRWTNKSYLVLHVIFVPVVGVAFWRRRDPRLVLLVLFIAVLIVLCSLINTQGDRYVEMALPLWTAAYALAVSDLLRPVAPRLSPATSP